MSSSRIAPLWRSSGRCLAVRPATAAARPPALAASTVTTLALRQRTAAVLPAAVRGYASDATTQGGDPTTSTEATKADAPLSTQPPAGQTIGATAEAPVPKAKQETNCENARRRLALLAKGKAPFVPAEDGHKFGLSTGATRASTAIYAEGKEADGFDGGVAFPNIGRVQSRHDELTDQLTRLMMRDGKLSKAQREMAIVLNFLRTAPTPKLDPAHPLFAGHPPAEQLPLNPALYLQVAIDSVSPMIRIMHVAGQAGGGRTLPVPVPLALRQRRRAAFMWLLEAVAKKQSRGSGRNTFATRIAEEVVAIVEGRSTLWDKRLQLHKLGTTSRINVSVLSLPALRKKGGSKTVERRKR